MAYQRENIIIEQKYGINDSLVATKPETILIYDDKYFSAALHLAEYQGHWAAASKLEIKGVTGPSSLPFFSGHRNLFKTRQEAKQDQLKFAHAYFLKYTKHPKGPTTKPVVAAIFKEMNPQLTLF